MNNAQWIVLYVLVVTALSFILVGLDKYQAKRNKQRVPEIYLFFLALLGGSAGAWSAMYFFHHKTRKLKFVVGMPLIFFAQVIVAIFVVTSKF